MKTTAKPQVPPKRRVRLLLILSLGLALLPAASAFPQAVAAVGSRTTVSQAVVQELPSGLSLKELPSPKSLQDFAQLTISRLAADAPFKEWSRAKAVYYPLGPGTHSWLINVMDGEQRIGYLIVSATEDGGYALSEYGAGTDGLPYSMTDLHRFLVQEELISTSSAGTIELTALYAPLLPVWKLKLSNEIYYLSAVTLEILPWSSSKASSVLQAQGPAAELVTSLNAGWAAQPVYRSGGQDDPYADLQWLASPKLNTVDGDKVVVLLGAGGALAFQSAGKNDLAGAPFMLTGYQRWQSSVQTSSRNNAVKNVYYTATGLQGRRYLPLALLQQTGTLHKLPGARNIASSAGTAPASAGSAAR